jgi:hypothetical protein
MIILGQATVPSSSTVAVFFMPPGTANTVMWQPTPVAAQVYVGQKSVTAVSGLAVPLTPVLSETYVTTGGMTYYATTGSTTAASFMFIVNTGA